MFDNAPQALVTDLFGSKECSDHVPIIMLKQEREKLLKNPPKRAPAPAPAPAPAAAAATSARAPTAAATAADVVDESMPSVCEEVADIEPNRLGNPDGNMSNKEVRAGLI
jgi:hypothetical protein